MKRQIELLGWHDVWQRTDTGMERTQKESAVS